MIDQSSGLYARDRVVKLRPFQGQAQLPPIDTDNSGAITDYGQQLSRSLLD